MLSDAAAYFSPDYFSARERFRAAVRDGAAILHTLDLGARGPREEPLAIDIAWLGDPAARRIMLHTSGLHGVEAFAGAAIQLATLADVPVIPDGCALILVHVLNPYGMAWLRRANENNVDLNRNFLLGEERWEGAPLFYPRLDPLLNPSGPPRADGFRLRLAMLALRHGLRAPRQAIAEGQYEYPDGLFYGGKQLETGPRLYLEWLRKRLTAATAILALDTHTGLGKWGESTLILEYAADAATVPALSQALGQQLVDPAAGQAAYRVRGGMGPALPRALPEARIDFVLQEIGTSSAFRVLDALRDENRLHHYGTPDLRHPAKLALLEAMRPASSKWRQRAVGNGVALLHRAAAWAFGAQSPKHRHHFSS